MWFFEYVKMVFMFSWRGWLLVLFISIFQHPGFSVLTKTFAVGFALIVPAILIFGFHRTLPTFPIKKSFDTSEPTSYIDGEPVYDNKLLNMCKPNDLHISWSNRLRNKKHGYSSSTSATNHDIWVPSNLVTNNYAPILLKDKSLPDTNYLHGLNPEHSPSTEVNFAKALNLEKLADSYAMCFSVAVPHPYAGTVKHPEFDGNISCVMFGGDIIYLLDIKNYVGGRITYSVVGENIEGSIPNTGGMPRTRDKTTMDMAYAVQAYKLLYPDTPIVPVVILMPTSGGEPEVEPGTCFPGDVPVINLTDFIRHLKSYNHPSFKDSASDEIRLALENSKSLIH